MEDPEVPMESVHEHIEHHAHLAPERWISLVALSTAILAAFAAVASMLAGSHANEAMVAQIQSTDQWEFYQAKGIKAAVLESRIELLQSLGKPVPAIEPAKLSAYAKEQVEIKTKANEAQHEAEVHLRRHEVLAGSVTMFQIAIAVSAISVLTKRRRFWAGSLVFGLVGIGLLFWDLLPFHS
jgi:hypothetical protein